MQKSTDWGKAVVGKDLRREPEKATSLHNARGAIVELAIFSFFVNALLLVMPIYLLQVYDRVLPSSSLDTLVFLSIIAASAIVLLAILEAVRGVYASRMAARLDVSRSRDALIASMESPRAALGDTQAMRDLETVRRLVASRAVFSLFDLPFAPLFIGLLWLIHPLLFWVTAGGAAVLAAVAVVNQRLTAAAHKESAASSAQAMTAAQSFVRNSETLRSMGMMDNAVGFWANLHASTLGSSDRAGRINSVLTGFSRFLRMGLQTGILGVGAWLVLSGEMTAGMIFACSLISGRGLQPIDQVIGGWPQFIEAWNAWLRFRQATGDRQEVRQYTDLPAPTGRVDIQDLIYFAPNSEKQSAPILKRVGFRVPAGSVVGIVGPSGAGKSTLARLLVGATRPSGGTVRLDGADIANWDPNILGRHIGYLAQEVELLPGTIAQNIGRFAPDADDEAVVDAARRAQVHELILSLPSGYDTVIGPQGMRLSGGQRQRIGLARAFFGNPCLLVLDEPNANLDHEGELALEKAVDAARASGATVLIVTQRRSIANKVDALLMLRDGLIEDYGPREDVLRRQGERAAAAAQANSKQAANKNLGNVRQPAGGDSQGQTSPFAGYGPGLRPISTEQVRK